MNRLQIYLYALVIPFFGWCLFAFKADIVQVNFTSVWNAKDVIFFAVFLSLVNYVLRITRWVFFLNRMGHTVLPFGFSGLAYLTGFAYTLSPGKVGELMGNKYYFKRGIQFSDTTATFFVERALDFLAVTLLALLSFSAISDYRNLMLFFVFALVVCLCVLGGAPWARICRWVERSTNLPGAVKRVLAGALRIVLSARVLLRPLTLIIGFLLGLIAWGAEGVGLWVISGLAPHIALGWADATGIYATAIVVGALSFLPGGLGSAEAVMGVLLVAKGYQVSEAVLLTLVCRLLTLWLAVVLGWVAVACLRLPFCREQKGAVL